MEGGTPRGVSVPAAFFLLSGLLDLGLAVYDAPRPVPFWPIWEALGRAILNGLLAWGLWNRVAFCRQVALVYCLAMIPTYLFAIGLAHAQAPFRFSTGLVVKSLFEVPSCALLFPYLRSPAASALYTRPLLGR